MTGFPRVLWGPVASAHKASFQHFDDIIAIDKILWLAHVIPLQIDGDNTDWLVNNFIDLET